MQQQKGIASMEEKVKQLELQMAGYRDSENVRAKAARHTRGRRPKLPLAAARPHAGSSQTLPTP